MIAHCLRYHQKKKELKEQQDRVRILRKKWRGSSTFSHRSTESIPWCKWWCSGAAQHNPETSWGFCLRPKWLGESDEYENADKKCSSLGQFPPVSCPNWYRWPCYVMGLVYLKPYRYSTHVDIDMVHISIVLTCESLGFT